MKQEMNKYNPTDLWVWKTLFSRQFKNLQPYACTSYLYHLNEMCSVLNEHEIPDISKINSWLSRKTGWQIEVVPGLIPIEEFFELLAQKKFCSSTWLRSPDSLDYLEEPDMFHDVFGHIPLLAHPVFSDFILEFGKLGLKYKDNANAILALKRFYWFTIEFGLMRESSLSIYGAGIISSFGETNISVSSQVKNIDFNLEQILHKDFRTDIMQEEYFVIDSFENLFHSLHKAEEIISTLPSLCD